MYWTTNYSSKQCFHFLSISVILYFYCAWIEISNCPCLNFPWYLWYQVLKCWLLPENVHNSECDSEPMKWKALFKYILPQYLISILILIVSFFIVTHSPLSVRLYTPDSCHVIYLSSVKRIPIHASLNSDLIVWLTLANGKWANVTYTVSEQKH